MNERAGIVDVGLTGIAGRKVNHLRCADEARDKNCWPCEGTEQKVRRQLLQSLDERPDSVGGGEFSTDHLNICRPLLCGGILCDGMLSWLDRHGA